MATKKAAGKGSRPKAGAETGTKPEEAVPKSMPKGGKDPKGGLTAKGREFFNKTEGSHLRPGVQGPADTPEKMVRKGSFLRRHFAHPRGPMKDPKGQPTRLALSAHAWGEPVPETDADARKLADEGHELLEQYHAAKDGEASAKAAGKKAAGGKSAKKAPAKKALAGGASASKKTVSKKAVSKKAVSKKAVSKKAVSKKAAAKRGPGKKIAGNTAPGKRVANKKTASKKVARK